MTPPRTTRRLRVTGGAAVVVSLLLFACRPYGRVIVAPAEDVSVRSEVASPPPRHELRPVPRYGGAVLVSQSMPADQASAYRWARHIGTLVSYETFLRQYPFGARADGIRRLIRERFVPADEQWQADWSKYARLDTISGATVDPKDGFILWGQPAKGRLPPFFYDDLIVAIRCLRDGETIGVTMIRVFPARFDQPEDPKSVPSMEFETSVEFYARRLWNTHLAFVLFEGDRMLKSLGAGFDMFRGEPVRSTVPGFATQIEMASEEPLPDDVEDAQMYGRVWIELTGARINTTNERNVARFAEVKMEVRAESKHRPPIKFAKHLEDHYSAYAEEFVIFAEVERAARVVAIAQWLVDNYPAEAGKLAVDSFRPVKVVVPQVVRARWDKTHDTPKGPFGLIGGVDLSPANHYDVDPTVLVAETPLSDVAAKIAEAKPTLEARAWEVRLGTRPEDVYVAWRISDPPSSAQ